MSSELMTPEIRAKHLESVLLKTMNFLRTEIYTTPAVLQELLGYKTKHGTIKALRRLESDGLIKYHKLQSLGARGLTLWGITAHGQLMAWPPEEIPNKQRYFEPSRISITTLQHTIDIQRLRIHADNQGIAWEKPEPKPHEKRKVPDGVATLDSSEIIAVEVERTVKTLKRYREIITDYLQLIRGKKYHRVHYVCPNDEFAEKLKMLFSKVTSITVNNREIQLEERHHDSFQFFSLENWPKNPS